MKDLQNKIQAATLGDLGYLERLIKICNTYKTPDKIRWDRDLLTMFFNDKNAKILVYKQASVVGCVIARYNDDYSKLHIHNIFVDPSYQNSGIGTALINALINDANIHGTDYICTLNSHANKYFEKLSFFKGKIYLWRKLTPFDSQKHNNMI